MRGSGASRALRYMCTPLMARVGDNARSGTRRRHKISKMSSEGFDSPRKPAGRRAGKIQSNYLRAVRRSAPATSYHKAPRRHKALPFREAPRLTWPRGPKNTPSTLPMAPRARKRPQNMHGPVKTGTPCTKKGVKRARVVTRTATSPSGTDLSPWG